MHVSIRKIHQYLGMQLDFSSAGQLALTMPTYVKEMVDDFAKYDKTKTMANTPAADHFFQVDDSTTKVPSEDILVFHNFVTMTLFLAKHARPDIATAVAFLTIRVSKPDEDN